MIEFFSNWVKGIGVAIVIVSIIEILLPNNKTKKYIQMLLGIFVLFNIISPLVQNTDLFSLSAFSLEDYGTVEASSSSYSVNYNNTISKLYEEELEKDIENKLEEMGYLLNSCDVSSKVANEEYEIIQIVLDVDKNEQIEDKVVSEIKKIKKVEIGKEQIQEEKKLDDSDYQKIKKFLIEEYGVNEKCLKIN